MGPLLVVLAALVVAVEVVLVVVLVRLRKGRAAAEAEAGRMKVERATLADEAAALSARVRDVEAAEARAREQAEQASSAAAAAGARADVAERRMAEAHERAGQLEVDLAVARASTADGAMLWDLEIARAERIWHESVSPGIDVPSPLRSTSDRLKAVLTILVNACREESGTQVSLAYDLRNEPAAPAALAVTRAVDALLAPLAKQAETVAVAVAGDESCFVHIRAVDGDGTLVPPSVPPVLKSMVTSDDRGITLRCS
ncbi:MAG TPA: hypothetical protein VF855_05510 [Acidimicrobiales bacterium]